MRIDHLQTFLKVVEDGSISKVAEEMNISQSALSQQIKNFEEYLKTPLLDRGPNGVVPNTCGKIVYRHAQQLSATWKDMELAVHEALSSSLVFKIAATPNIYSYALPCTLFHIRNRFPDFVLDIEMMSSQQVEQHILNGFADIGFVIGAPETQSLYRKKVFTDKMHLVQGEQSITPQSIACSELLEYPLMMLSQRHRTRQLLDKYLKMIGIKTSELKILYELNSTESLKMSTIHGFGLSFAPYMSIKKELYNQQLNIVQLDCFDLESEYYLIRKEKSNDKTAAHKQVSSYIEGIVQTTVC